MPLSKAVPGDDDAKRQVRFDLPSLNYQHIAHFTDAFSTDWTPKRTSLHATREMQRKWPEVIRLNHNVRVPEAENLASLRAPPAQIGPADGAPD